MLPLSFRYTRRKNFGSALSAAEIIPVLCIGSLVLLISTANLIGLCLGYASAYLVGMESCSHAANASGFDNALQNMIAASSSLVAGDLGKLGRLSSVGGLNNSGIDLYILQTNIFNGQTTVIGPNKPLPAVDAVSNVYQIETRCTFKSAPVVAAARIPGLGAVPGFGEPVQMTCALRHVLDRPELFVVSASIPQNNPLTPTTDETQPAGLSVLANWDYGQQNNFQLGPGQQVLSTSDQIVLADNASWQPLLDSNSKPLVLQPNQRLTLVVTTQKWSDQYNNWVLWMYGDGSAPNIDNIRTATLTAKIGKAGPEFPVSNSFYNFSYPSAGNVYVRFNDSIFASNLGQISLKAYITN
jgi:hypothetical protein